jgi:hypothetical protein
MRLPWYLPYTLNSTKFPPFVSKTKNSLSFLFRLVDISGTVYENESEAPVEEMFQSFEDIAYLRTSSFFAVFDNLKVLVFSGFLDAC